MRQKQKKKNKKCGKVNLSRLHDEFKSVFINPYRIIESIGIHWNKIKKTSQLLSFIQWISAKSQSRMDYRSNWNRVHRTTYCTREIVMVLQRFWNNSTVLLCVTSFLYTVAVTGWIVQAAGPPGTRPVKVHVRFQNAHVIAYNTWRCVKYYIIYYYNIVITMRIRYTRIKSVMAITIISQTAGRTG